MSEAGRAYRDYKNRPLSPPAEPLGRATCLLTPHAHAALKRRELLTTETELSDMAAAAISGESRIPRNG